VPVGTDNGREANIWIYDLAGTTSMRQLTFAGKNRFPVWSGDGTRIAFQSDRDGDAAIFSQLADGSGTAERLTKPDAGSVHIPESWSSDGKRLSFEVIKGRVETLWMLTLPEKAVAPFGDVQNEAPITIGSTFSPDGRWLAYASTEGSGGNVRIFVQPVPRTGSKYVVSVGIQPIWSRDGKELAFDRQQTFSVVSVKTEPSFASGNPVALPKAGLRIMGPVALAREYDMMPDGKRFIGVIDTGQGQSRVGATQIQVVLNWFEELKQRVPVK
jgi:eukaryotic-like serine/threonine-protein kinase